MKIRYESSSSEMDPEDQPIGEVIDLPEEVIGELRSQCSLRRFLGWMDEEQL